MQEIPQEDSDIALFVGGAHIGSVADILCKLGSHELHRDPKEYPREHMYIPLEKSQLSVFDLQEPTLAS